MITKEKGAHTAPIQDKFDLLANFVVQNPVPHILQDFSDDMLDLMYWGITYTKQLHSWLCSLTWESQPSDSHPDISYLELYVNFK